MYKKYGLLGHPLGHSFSRKFHNERFSRLGIDAEYVNFDLENISLFPTVLANDPLLCGLNVTIPYKQQVMQFLDELDPVAARIGAVNTICIKRFSSDEVGIKGSKLPGLWLKGYNTDIIGFRDSIRPSLEDMGIAYTFVSRTPSSDRLSYEQLTPEVMSAHKVIINCSPVGTYPNVDACPAIPYECLSSKHVCYDLVYNPEVTLFMAKAKEKGAFTMNGGAMLEGQAIASYNYWTAED